MFSFQDGAENMAEAAGQMVVEATDEEVDAIIEECGGDPRRAIRALLHDLTILAVDAEASVSHGYIRGRPLPFQTLANPEEKP
jgi:hypothetical protein